ncbi:MAG: hypothetical protein ACRC6M_13915 [Microcystaceae cyanobacterium]
MSQIPLLGSLVKILQRQARLRTVLLIPFVLQILGTVGIVSYLYFLNGNQAVNELAQQLQIRASKEVEEHLNNYFNHPRQVIQLMVKAVESGRLDLNNIEKTESYLWELAQIYPEVSYLNYGMENGTFIGLGRANNFSKTIYIEESFPNKWIVYCNMKPCLGESEVIFVKL